MHVFFSTVCNPYGDWQSEGLVYSHFVTRMKGTLTRISSCSNPNYQYPKMWHPCYSIHVVPDLAGKVRTQSSRAGQGVVTATGRETGFVLEKGIRAARVTPD